VRATWEEILDTAEVEVFLVLAEELHFGHTAERLHLPQPRVSRLIARLERRAGGMLFDRTNRRVRLTPLGEQLRGQLGPVYAQLTAALESTRAASRGLTGQLRLGFIQTTPNEPLTKLAQAFESRHPECRVTLHEHLITGDDWDLWRPLREGSSDALLYWNGTNEPDLSTGPVIIRLNRVLLVAAGHRLAGRESVSVEDLACERVVQVSPSANQDLMDALIPPVSPSGRPIPRTEPVRSFREILYLVGRGRIVHPTYVGVLPARHPDIAAIPIRDLPPLPMGLIWCTAHESARIRAMVAISASIAAPTRAPGRGSREPPGLVRA
jgi:DNA-binding transcriptional LysR family regulator